MEDKLIQFFDDFVYSSSIVYFQNWIATLPEAGILRRKFLAARKHCRYQGDIRWIDRFRKTCVAYEEQMQLYRDAIQYLQNRLEAQRVVREGLLVDLLRTPLKRREARDYGPRVHQSPVVCIPGSESSGRVSGTPTTMTRVLGSSSQTTVDSCSIIVSVGDLLIREDGGRLDDGSDIAGFDFWEPEEVPLIERGCITLFR